MTVIMSWTRFPVELRLMILENVPKSRDTVAYATVCREWQLFFEQRHFEMIKLSQTTLWDFLNIIRAHRRKFVKHIWLRIELETYDCRICKGLPGVNKSRRNAITFTKMVLLIYTFLSFWEKPLDLNAKGLTLEVSVYSPSDSEHTLKDHNFAHDPYSEPSEGFRNLAAQEQMGPEFHDPRHLWRNGQRQLVLPVTRLQHLTRLMKFKVDDLWSVPTEDNFLPKVHVVTTFLVRRQYFRRIPTTAMEKMLESLVGLQHVIYEPGGERLYLHQPVEDETGYRRVFDGSIPGKLKQLTIYEDCDQDSKRNVDFLYVFREHHGWPQYRTPELGLSLSRRSRNLEHLSISFLIDAVDFFIPLQPPMTEITNWIWPELRTIALTSKLMCSNRPEEELDGFLRIVGIVARNMPRLQVMELWNGEGDTDGCVFRYCYDERVATITWMSTWGAELTEEAIQTWTNTTRQRNQYADLEVVYATLRKDGTKFPASVLRHLELKDRVLHPVSYRQVQLIGAPRDPKDNIIF
ncbi:hypothetical protein F4804DRAFT_351209 [Jackrogersella minutella]|nr:hypothetical protein F4804DRAFT_351209 [Jackrogersella minutella]